MNSHHKFRNRKTYKSPGGGGACRFLPSGDDQPCSELRKGLHFISLEEEKIFLLCVRLKDIFVERSKIGHDQWRKTTYTPRNSSPQLEKQCYPHKKRCVTSCFLVYRGRKGETDRCGVEACIMCGHVAGGRSVLVS